MVLGFLGAFMSTAQLLDQVAEPVTVEGDAVGDEVASLAQDAQPTAFGGGEADRAVATNQPSPRGGRIQSGSVVMAQPQRLGEARATRSSTSGRPSWPHTGRVCRRC
ncbi:hypothetical protein AQJ91_06670 [Streptomyces dysideae]|uniref:Uncharacterized protein n=1 Tax=Streptomyces dysideae TaxID=909626 RepID=A0A124IFL4_9ACTN|nr:hypothetical protein AQJ91_06670 [Streptomyces dysideae]